jgi:hypothetical protein
MRTSPLPLSLSAASLASFAFVPTALQTAVVHPLTGELLALGGTPQGIAKAQRDAFGRVDRFLAAALK